MISSITLFIWWESRPSFHIAAGHANCQRQFLPLWINTRIYVEAIVVTTTQNRVRCHYKEVTFSTNYHKRHAIAHSLGWGVECLLWVEPLNDIQQIFIQGFCWPNFVTGHYDLMCFKGIQNSHWYIYRNCPEVWKCSGLPEFQSDYVLKFG